MSSAELTALESPQAGVPQPARPPASSYDRVPYSVHAFAQTQPDRLAVIARLFGMHPAPPDRCRVLELGCASGGNLIPMALAAPDSRFVGIDLSQRQIAGGQSMLDQLALRNVELKALSILDVPGDLGPFDYILCHGVYSWVPPAVQEKILQICQRHLAPQGIAYISYNAYPGWHARGAIREMLCYHTERFEDPAERIRQARALLAFLATSMPARDGGYGALLRQEIATLAVTPDTYLLHEHLEDYNEPLYFHQFMSRAAAHQLQYLGEAQLSSMVAGRLGAETEKVLRQICPDLLHMEQYMDFLRNRMFRQTLLCRDDIALDHALRPEQVQTFFIASCAKPASEQPDLHSSAPEKFAVADGLALTTPDPLMKSAMLQLHRLWPLSLPFPDLLAAASRAISGHPSPDEARALASRLLNCFASSVVEFSLRPAPFVAHLTARPIASPYARLRAALDDRAVNLRLESSALSQPARLILRHLDGQHDHAALADLIMSWLDQHSAAPPADLPASAAATESPRARAERYVDELLRGFAKAAFLIG